MIENMRMIVKLLLLPRSPSDGAAAVAVTRYLLKAVRDSRIRPANDTAAVLKIADEPLTLRKYFDQEGAVGTAGVF